MSTTNEQFTLYLFDQSGRVIHNGTYTNGQQVQHETLATGVYYWRAISDSMIRTGKVLVSDSRR